MAKNRYLIEYYTQDELSYANRKRYKTFSYNASSSEYQYAVRLGDGASTSIKTSLENLSNYVCISLQTLDDNTQLYNIIFTTRWYVVSYLYLNGGQIELFLQRDVIGENGLDGFFGKVERGYTETFLRNRKELSLNQILLKRTKLVSSDDKYGNYTVNSHENEKWGVIYLSKPTELDPITQQPYPTSGTINVPAFAPKIDNNLSFVANDTSVITYVRDNEPILNFFVKIQNTTNGSIGYYELQIKFHYNQNENTWEYYLPDTTRIFEMEEIENYMLVTMSRDEDTFTTAWRVYRAVGYYFAERGNVNGFLPYKDNDADIPDGDYNGKNIKATIEGVEKTIQYTVTNEQIVPSVSQTVLKEKIIYAVDHEHVSSLTPMNAYDNNATIYTIYYDTFGNKATYTYRVLSNTEAGNITIDFTKRLLDEPYICYVIPLYDVTITDGNNHSYVIEQDSAFSIFNSLIEFCSGENSYLVDAQIYPYCPDLSDIAYSLGNYPIFNVISTTYFRKINVSLLPYLDVKKEYIKRDYYIKSPEQSADFHFNFYDYTNEKTIYSGDKLYNHQELEVIIKTSLKPMNIIASAVITPQSNSLKGIPYDSDLRGCQPTSNGFECTLSTNKFQEYIRNNSNYQAIFGLQQEELKRQHMVERSNETASAVMNTLSATMMGAIGGAALSDISYFGTSAKAIGAIAGAATAGATVGTTMAVQKLQNDKLREYEEYLQKQNFDLQIGTIKNIPNTVSRISSFNEIIMQDFYFVIETYECSREEGSIVDTFVDKYGYQIGVFGNYEDFEKNKWFLKGTLITSNLLPIHHNVAQKEIMGGIYYYE